MGGGVGARALHPPLSWSIPTPTTAEKDRMGAVTGTRRLAVGRPAQPIRM